MQDSLLAVIFKNFEITLIIFFAVYKLGMKKKNIYTIFLCWDLQDIVWNL